MSRWSWLVLAGLAACTEQGGTGGGAQPPAGGAAAPVAAPGGGAAGTQAAEALAGMGGTQAPAGATGGGGGAAGPAAATSRAACVDAWLEARGLNEYGDPPGTMYTGGTPLFDETTGERTERIPYLLEKLPALREACP